MATRYFVGGGTGNWDSTTNWSTLSGGASGASAPIDGDIVILDSLSGTNTLTINVASACSSLDCTGFTGTLAGTSQLSVAGNFTLGTGMINTYTGNLIISATSTINTSGIDLYVLTTSTNLATYTLASNIKVTNTWHVNGGGVVYFSGAFTVEVTGIFNCNSSGGSLNSLTNNTIILLSENSTWAGYSGAINTGVIFLGFTININSITTNITNNFRLESNVSLSRIAGVVNTTTSNLGLRGANITLDTNNIQWTNLSTITGVTTVTLLSDLNVTGNYTNGVISTFTGAFNINVGGSLTTSAIINGSGALPTIVLNGTGTWSGTSHISTNLIINTAGTITITGSVSFLQGNFSVLLGTVVTTGTTLNITGNATLNTSSVSWNNIIISGSTTTLTLGQDLYVTGQLQTTGSTNTINGNNIYLSGSLSQAATSATVGTSHLRFTGASCTWAGSTSLRLDVTVTGTVTFTSAIGYSTGTFTCITGSVISTGRVLTIPLNTGNTTFNCPSVTFNQIIQSGTNGTITLLADLTTTTFVSATGAGGTILAGAFTLKTSFLTTTSPLSGTPIILNGTGTWSGSGRLSNNLTINTAGTVTLSGSIAYSRGTLTYVTGTVITTSSTLSIGEASTTATLDTSGMNFNNVTFTLGSTTINLLSNLNIIGNLQIASAIVINGYSVYIGGNLSFSNSTSSTGTTNYIMNGTGTWSNASPSVTFSNNLIFNTSGTITISGFVYYGAGTITYTAGTIITTGSTLTSTTTTIMNTDGMSWNNITFYASSQTINSVLNCVGTFTLGNAASSGTLIGSAGFSVGTFTTNGNPGINLTLKSGNTYIVNNAFIITTATNASRITLKSSTPGVKAIFTLDASATQNIGYVNATDIDSSLGQTIYSANGVLNNTLNWDVLAATSNISGGTFTFY